jgi:hypothetical protein
MGLKCLVIPRADLVPAECRRLGEALHRWLSSAPTVRSVEPLGLNDLRDGELPQPQCLRLAWAAGVSSKKSLSTQQMEDIRTRLGERAGARDLECHIWDASEEDVHEAALGFDQVIPSDLVDDILIDGKSWKRLKPGPAARRGTECTLTGED